MVVRGVVTMAKPIRSIKTEELTDGTVIVLPMGRTATVKGKPSIGRKYVTIRTQHGKARLLIGDEILVEGG